MNTTFYLPVLNLIIIAEYTISCNNLVPPLNKQCLQNSAESENGMSVGAKPHTLSTLLCAGYSVKLIDS